MFKLRACLLPFALFAAAQPQVALAQSCVSENDISALYVYSMPTVIEATRNSCDQVLARDGFLARNGNSLIGKYAELKGDAWPSARRAILAMADMRGGIQGQARIRDLNLSELLTSLPDDVARPLADAFIVEKVAQKVEPRNCGKYERVAEAIAEIEPHTAATLVGTLVGLVGAKEAEICTTE